MGISQLAEDFIELVKKIEKKIEIPNIRRVFFPKLDPNIPIQPKNEKFVVIQLEGGTVGVCHTLIPPHYAEKYNLIKENTVLGKNPLEFAYNYGTDDPVDNVFALASINVISQYVMNKTNFFDTISYTSDPTGNLDIQNGDIVGMVGLFIPLVKIIEKIGCQLIVLEKRDELLKMFPKLNITLDPYGINKCNKILCTSTTLLNNTLEDVMKNCNPDAKISVIGPTGQFLPDPIFKLGVDVLGGRTVVKEDLFFENVANHKKWGKSTRKYCLEREFYPGIREILKNLK
jgi:uncharacterized protein (DUF4213/DUF364 family)